MSDSERCVTGDCEMSKRRKEVNDCFYEYILQNARFFDFILQNALCFKLEKCSETTDGVESTWYEVFTLPSQHVKGHTPREAIAAAIAKAKNCSGSEECKAKF